MTEEKRSLISSKLSLVDMLGEEYLKAVCEAKAFLTGENQEKLWNIAQSKVDFFPPMLVDSLDERIKYIGKTVVGGLESPTKGASTGAFNKAANSASAPLSALGFYRIGEDGKVYLTSKSEHYHTPLGHDFPGYNLVDNARALGIPNATHNNTRGTITRQLEIELVRVTNGIKKDDDEALQQVLTSTESHVLNRVINLETGSLAVEAALKMMLARFYRLDNTYSKPEYEGKVPVFFVMADNIGGKEANYHGTTVLTQLLRGMWPEFYDALEQNDIFRVQPVMINNIEDFQSKIEKFDNGKYRVAGFFHEIVLMNYGGIKLTKDYLTKAYEICHKRDIPVLVDEIQSCLWSPEFFLFKEYGLKPDFVSIGKGFPGGQYPASRVITTAKMDNLNLFGALVTNGQEELAALTYLITMRFAEDNREYTYELGEYYESKIRDFQNNFKTIIDNVEGSRHMTTIIFKDAEEAIVFAKELSSQSIDVSVQTYKANCAPAALTKIPLISSRKMVDFMIEKMRKALEKISIEKSNK